MKTCPGCGATENAGCVVDLRQMPGRGAWIEGAVSLLCVGHNRPYWLAEDDPSAFASAPESSPDKAPIDRKDATESHGKEQRDG
jgi:hypothetical protein